ncbi:MAG: SH3 domain-containing protein [Nitrospina sp.]|nr:SH3 domain-containing protein [Nitrospina sp.]
MKASENFNYYPKIKRRYQYCDTCETLLPAPGFYCIKCSPPIGPEPDHGKGLSLSQACLRITLLGLIFVVIIYFKLGLDLPSLVLNPVHEEIPLKEAVDEDYKIVFKVNVSFANLRNEPNLKTSTIIFVLNKGTQVEILDKKGKWSKIRTQPKPGEKARTGWLSNKLLDSEIK